MNRSPNFPKELDEITDVIDRALLRETLRLEQELAYTQMLLNDKPYLDQMDLIKESQQWLNDHTSRPTASDLEKLNELSRRSKAIQQRLNRWKRLDQIKLMNHEFDLQQQIGVLQSERRRRVLWDRTKIADDAIVGKFRASIKLEEIHLKVLSRHFAKTKEAA